MGRTYQGIPFAHGLVAGIERLDGHSRGVRKSFGTSKVTPTLCRQYCLGSAWNGEATFSVSEYSALRAGIFKAWGLSIRWRLGGARTSSHAPVHRLDEPTGISLGMVASPQCLLPFRPAKSL